MGWNNQPNNLIINRVYSLMERTSVLTGGTGSNPVIYEYSLFINKGDCLANIWG